MFKFCVLIRWDFNFYIRRTPRWGGGENRARKRRTVGMCQSNDARAHNHQNLTSFRPDHHVPLFIHGEWPLNRGDATRIVHLFYDEGTRDVAFSSLLSPLSSGFKNSHFPSVYRVYKYKTLEFGVGVSRSRRRSQLGEVPPFVGRCCAKLD